MATIDVPSFEQIATILSQLATNYSNLFADYYNLFYNPTPMDVTIQLYDDEGNLSTITIPNRAKDRNYILNGNGEPEGNVSAAKGSVYQDLTDGTAYIKQFANTDNTGWSELMTLELLESYLMQGSGSPEGVVAAPKGVLFIDRAGANLYLKATATGNTGWDLISANTTTLANVNLSNLSEVGESHFANLSLDNLNTAGSALIAGKENVSNKVTTLSPASTDTQYPSAKTVYDAIMNHTTNGANKSLNNLNETGEEHFVGMTQVRDCIFKAPNGLPSVSGNIISLPAGTIILCADGVNANNSKNNLRVTIANALSASVTWTNAKIGSVFYSNTSPYLRFIYDNGYFRQIAEPVVSTTHAMWYNPDTNIYKWTADSGESWTDLIAAEVGRVITNSSGVVTSFEPYHPLTVAMEDDITTLKAYADQIKAALPIIEYY